MGDMSEFVLNCGVVMEDSEDNCDDTQSATSDCSGEEAGIFLCNESLSVIDFDPLERCISFFWYRCETFWRWR